MRSWSKISICQMGMMQSDCWVNFLTRVRISDFWQMVKICNLRLKCMIFNVRKLPKVRRLHQIGEVGKWNHLSMVYSLINKYTKNYYNRTILARYRWKCSDMLFFETQCTKTVHTKSHKILKNSLSLTSRPKKAGIST